MMALQEQKTMSYSQTPERLAYEQRNWAVTALRLAAILPQTQWTPLESLRAAAKKRLRFRCSCGRERFVRPVDIYNGASGACRSCAGRRRMLDLSPSDRQRMARVASLAAKAASKLRKDPYASKYGPKALRCVLHRMSSARQRCSNPDNAAYISYGGRGIKFQFPSVRAAAEWILDNLGPS